MSEKEILEQILAELREISGYIDHLKKKEICSYEVSRFLKEEKDVKAKDLVFRISKW